MEALTLNIKGEPDIFFAQNEALKVLDPIGFNDLDQSRIKIIIAELAYNLIKYAQTGTIKLSRLDERGVVGVLVEAIDRGPGIKNLSKALTEHYSTTGTLGLGLTGIKRMSDSMTIDTDPTTGTHVKVKFWNK